MQLIANENEPTAKREVCRACRDIVIPHVTADNGHLCRKCCDSATEIRFELVIRGITYIKNLRRLAVVPTKEKPAVTRGQLKGNKV